MKPDSRLNTRRTIILPLSHIRVRSDHLFGKDLCPQGRLRDELLPYACAIQGRAYFRLKDLGLSGRANATLNAFNMLVKTSVPPDCAEKIGFGSVAYYPT